ncbi:MAG TPA: TraR/DksA C4-type zinc finger protein [Pilimelia sp.]|nr:TraR/DksA C4-type zinc finger protein [Pilimelia sp.]
MLVEDTRAVVTPLRGGRSAAEIDQIRDGLRARYDELHAECEHAVAETKSLSREYVADSAGDDDADSGAKTSERECELSVIRSIMDRREQVERALARLAEGRYGWCEGCGGPIPVERLAVFPWATSCVACKRARERRAS